MYSDHEYVKRQQQNTIVTLQTKPMKRGNTDCRRFSKIRSIEFATKPKRGKFTVKIIFFETTIGSKNYLCTFCKIDTRTVRATTRSGYVISCNLMGSELNQNIDLTSKGLSSTEMSNRETSKQIAVECFGWDVP